jgi:hypothetical protein
MKPPEPEKPPAVAVVEDLLGIATSRLRNDYVGEISNWAYLGRDVMLAVLTRQQPTQ